MNKSTRNAMLVMLIASIITLFVTAAQAKDTGCVVGRVYLKVDCFQNVNRDIIGPAKVEVAYVKAHKITTINTTTDTQGYYQPMDGHYFPYKIWMSGSNQLLPSVVPDPDPSEGAVGLLYYIFSYQREAIQTIIDCGETVILLKAGVKMGVERSYKKNRTIIDYTKMKGTWSID
jgi:hypothetical protein